MKDKQKMVETKTYADWFEDGYHRHLFGMAKTHAGLNNKNNCKADLALRSAEELIKGRLKRYAQRTGDGLLKADKVLSIIHERFVFLRSGKAPAHEKGNGEKLMLKLTDSKKGDLYESVYVALSYILIAAYCLIFLSGAALLVALFLEKIKIVVTP